MAEALVVDECKMEEEFMKDWPRLRFRKGAYMIKKFGIELGCRLITTVKAKVLFHRYQRSRKDSNCHALGLAAACLNLTIRQCGDYVNTNHLILTIYRMQQEFKNVPIPNDPSPELLTDLKETLVAIEYAICKELAFDINCNTAHMDVFNNLEYFQHRSGMDDSAFLSMTVATLTLLNTFYLCERSLEFEVADIAMACLQFALHYLGDTETYFRNLILEKLKSYERQEQMDQCYSVLILVSDAYTADVSNLL